MSQGDSPGATSPPAYHPTEPSPSKHEQSAVQLGEQYRAQLYGRCAQGYHERTIKFGLCGILSAIFCFPFGLICLFIDTERVCARCGVRY